MVRPWLIIQDRKISIENENRCRELWCAKKYTNKEGHKSEGKYTKRHPSLHLFTIEGRCRDGALYIYLHFYILVCLCTFWHTIIFSDFSVLFLYFFLVMFSVML